MKHKLTYLKHMWKYKNGRFVCLRRKCKATKKIRVDPKTLVSPVSEECRQWEKEKNG
jgi:hypothetical protein